jgi:hypothetical protein
LDVFGKLEIGTVGIVGTVGTVGLEADLLISFDHFDRFSSFLLKSMLTFHHDSLPGNVRRSSKMSSERTLKRWSNFSRNLDLLIRLGAFGPLGPVFSDL